MFFSKKNSKKIKFSSFENESYYARWLRLKPLVLAQQQIITNIKGTFEYLYHDKDLPETVNILGSGSTHKVFNIGLIVDSKNNNCDIHLALRLCKPEPIIHYDLNTENGKRYFVNNIYAFEDFFNKRENVPYFCGPVSFDVLHSLTKTPVPIGGFLLEDVTHNGKYTLIDDFEVYGTSNYVKRLDKSPHKLFLDPSFTTSYPKSFNDYLSEESMLNL